MGEEKRGKSKDRMDERKRGKKLLSSPTPRLQCSSPTDSTDRERKRKGMRKKKMKSFFTLLWTMEYYLIQGPRSDQLTLLKDF